jgi:hypothetical protein
MKRSAWESIHGKFDFLARLDKADISFSDAGFDLHFAEIIGDDE